jgi:hypothetical protein
MRSRTPASFPCAPRAAGSTPYEIPTDAKLNPLRQLLDAARLANARDSRNVAALQTLAEADDAAVRWWGLLGLSTLAPRSHAAFALSKPSLTLSEYPNACVAQAEALARLSSSRAEGLRRLTEALRHDSPLIRLAALNALDRLSPQAAAALPAVKNAAIQSSEHPDAAEYVDRMIGYLPGRIGDTDKP